MFTHENATSRQGTEMAAKNRRELQDVGYSGDPIERLRLLCLSRGANGIQGLERQFNRMDEYGYKKLSFEEFILGLREFGLEISDVEARGLFEEFDTDGGGSINMDEFLMHVRPSISEARKRIIEEAFNKMDKNVDGKITIDDIKRVYNVNSDPRYISGEDSKEFILKKFLDNFEKETTADGIVTKEDFFNYYCGLSTSIDDDCYFNLIMRQAYKL